LLKDPLYYSMPWCHDAILHTSFWLTKAMMLAFILPSSRTKDRRLTTSADSFFAKIWLVFCRQACVLIPFLLMLLLQVRVKIVTPPWLAEVFEICGPFSPLFNIFPTDDRKITAHLLDGLLFENSRPYLNAHSDLNVLTLPLGFGMMY